MTRLRRITVAGNPRIVDSALGPTLRPFAPSSIWKLGISTTATFAATGDARNTSMHNTGADSSGLVWMNAEQYSHPVAYTRPADPAALVTDNTTQYTTWNEPIPSTARIASGDDKHMHVVTPDRRYIREYFGVTRNSPTDYLVQRRAQVSLRGAGIGPQNGCRAYGGSAIGGLIRAWEVNPAHPAYTGVIRHALACALRLNQMRFDSANWSGQSGYYDSGTLDTAKYPGWPAGTPAAGFMRQTGYVWPASEQDYFSPYSYTGDVPMGSYFAIPPGVNLTTLGLNTAQGMMIAKAAQDYGVYVTDASGASAFYCEDDGGGAATQFALGALGGDYSAHDVRVVFNALRVVTGNGPTTPNGGPLGTARRG